ncbi:uncharacterized protein KZ484_023343 [Pholidichthys leucotaenia]
MAQSCNPPDFRRRRLLLLLRLILALIHFATGTPQIQVKGEVGGNVTLRCNAPKRGTIEFLYLQKGQDFVNGYYVSKKINKAWQNTTVDRSESAVHMYRLNVSHGGNYVCHIKYKDTEIVDTHFYLSVTAQYSKPTVNQVCKAQGCLVTCTSHDGYPGSKMKWAVNSNLGWTFVNSSENACPTTMTFSISSTAYFNCSYGEMKLSCSVSGATSEAFTVCHSQDPTPTLSLHVIIAGVVIAIVMVIVVVVFLCKCRKGAATNTIERRAQEEETIGLSENDRAIEAS